MSFRSALLASAAILTAGSAFAADLPARSMAPAPYIAAAPIFTWTGFYVGLNAGAGWNNDSNGYGYSSFGTVVPTVYAGSNSNDAAFTGGAQIGYNMQFGSFVAGVEADINYIDRDNGGVGVAPVATAAGTYYTLNRSGGDNWFGTVRGRLGFAFDRALIFATGGLAFGGNGGSGYATQSVVTGTGPFTTTTTTLVGTGDSDSNIGWALGAGMEYAFTNSISFKVEYLHVDLGRNSRTFTTTAPAGGLITIRDDNKFDIVRAGVNFRF